jgi:hypothetical protein
LQELDWFGILLLSGKTREKMAKSVKSEFLPIGTKIAKLTHELGQIGAYQAMRKLQEAGEVFHQDVERILDLRSKNDSR